MAIFTGGYGRFREFGGCCTWAVMGGSGANGLKQVLKICSYEKKLSAIAGPNTDMHLVQHCLHMGEDKKRQLSWTWETVTVAT